jgi:iron complex outermembrane receptor protein
MNQKLSLLAGTILLGLNSTYSTAQSFKNKEQNTKYNNIESITVLGSAATADAELGGVSLKALPINTHVVGRAEIERLRFVNPNEFLDRIPGETQVRNLRIPDGGKSYTIPMLDGMPLESPYEGATQRLDRVNTFDIQRVEVIKGPASALYPNNAFGGIVNVVSRDAPLSPETRVSIEAGDFSRLRAGLSTGARVDKLGYFFDVNTRNLSGLRDESVNDRDQVSAKLAYQLSDATRVSTRIEYLDEYKIERADLTKEALETDPTQAGRLSSSTDLTQSSLSLNLEHLLESGQFDFALVRREKETVGESRFRGPQDENDLGYSSKLMYRHDFNQSNIIVGYNGYHGEQHTDQYERGDTDLSGSFRHSTYNLNINAYFAQYRLNASDDMILTGGLRYEKIHLASIHFTSNNDAQSADFSELAPKLGLTYQLNSDHMLWLGVSKGFYAPDLDDLYASDKGDPNLKPEEASNIEFGFRGHFGDWQYDTSIYHNNITHYLVTQEFENNDGTEYELTTNAGKVSIKGFESVIEYTPKDAHWRFGLTHTFARNKYDSFVQSVAGADDDLSGKILRRSPDHHLNARIAWLPIDKLSIELEGDFYSSYYADNENSPESEFTRDERINLRADYQLDHWRIWLHALNLSDTMQDRATYRRDVMSFRTIDGRTLYAGVSYTF